MWVRRVVSVLGCVLALWAWALPAGASTVVDHGSTVEAGCGAYYSATPDPATVSDEVSLTLSFACAPHQLVTYSSARLFVGVGVSHSGQTVQGYAQQVTESACTQDSTTGSLNCVFGTLPPGIYTAQFDWGLGEGGTGVALGHPGTQCWEWPEGGYSCTATLYVFVTG